MTSPRPKNLKLYATGGHRPPLQIAIVFTFPFLKVFAGE